MEKWTIPPNQTGYGLTDDAETISVKLDGGASKFRRTILNPAITVNVAWMFNNAQYTQFRTFYKVTTKGGSLPFLIDLYLNVGEQLTEHKVRIIPGTVILNEQRGHSFLVSCKLEIDPAY